MGTQVNLQVTLTHILASYVQSLHSSPVPHRILFFQYIRNWLEINFNIGHVGRCKVCIPSDHLFLRIFRHVSNSGLKNSLWIVQYPVWWEASKTSVSAFLLEAGELQTQHKAMVLLSCCVGWMRRGKGLQS